MKQLLNTLYVTTQGAYLARDGEAVAVRVEKETKLRVPIHTLSSIVCFGQVSCSPFLMGLCGESSVALAFLTENGQFLARVHGPVSGNVLLRREQYRWADREERAAAVARAVVLAKIANCRTVLLRALREKPDCGGRGGLGAGGPAAGSVAGDGSGRGSAGGDSRARGRRGAGVLRGVRPADRGVEGGVLLPRAQPAPAAGQHERAAFVRVHAADARRDGGAGSGGARPGGGVPASRPAGAAESGAGPGGGVAAGDRGPAGAFAGQPAAGAGERVPNRPRAAGW